MGRDLVARRDKTNRGTDADWCYGEKPKPPHEDATCSSCGRRAYDTCRGDGRCSCEDGRDDMARWIEPRKEDEDERFTQ